MSLFRTLITDYCEDKKLKYSSVILSSLAARSPSAPLACVSVEVEVSVKSVNKCMHIDATQIIDFVERWK